jgi:thiopurine S-methyltransferase
MQPDFWHERWRSGQIGFHQTMVDPSLRKLWPRFELGMGRRVFVPLSGKSLDMVWLREQGHRIVAAELSATAVEAFFMENGITARRSARGSFDLYQAEGLELFRGDYFEITAALLGDVAAVYDRAALISWAPELRKPYVERLASLTSAGVQMLLITLEYSQIEMPGPPFSVMPEEIDRLYSPHFEIHEISRRDILASEPRLRAKGVTQLCEVYYHLSRS